MDLHTRMHDLGGPLQPPTPDAVQGDLHRGRRAVRRRRLTQATAGSAMGIAAIAAAFALTLDAPAGIPTRPPVVAQSAATLDGLHLVSYTGAQPKGFTVDAVPAGFSIEQQSESALVLKPDAVVPRPSSSVPAGDLPPGMVDYNNKIAIYLEGKDSVDFSWGDTLTIDGKETRLRMTSTPEGPQVGGTFLIKQTPDVFLTVQIPAEVGLTKDQMTALAAGVHVTPEYLATFGR